MQQHMQQQEGKKSGSPTLSRRGFIGAMGAMGAAIPVARVAQAAQSASADATAGSHVSNSDLMATSTEIESPVRGIGTENGAFIAENRDTLVEMCKEFPVATEDLTLPDGTVVDKAYVTMYNQLNRIGEGLSGTPGVGSFHLLMEKFSVDEAQSWNSMPKFERFTALDWSKSAGISEDEATQILDGLADKRMIDRFDRAGVSWYYCTPYTGGIRIRLYREFTPDILRGCDMLRGVEQNTGSQYPVYHVCPVGPEAIDNGEVVHGRDWRAVIEQNTVFTAQPCGCRNSAALKGELPVKEEGIRHCLVFGELAQFLIDTGIPPMTKDEVLAEAEKLIDLGYVPEMVFSEHPDVMCFCKAERCTMLTAHRNLDGATVSFPHVAAYRLEFDRDKCIQCGACVSRCPMYSVSMGDDGYPTIDNACVGCGQCVLTCPASARVLTLRDEVPELPADLVDQTKWISADRMATNKIVDFTGSELPDYAVQISEAANKAREQQYHWLIDTKPTVSPSGCADGTYTAQRIGLQGYVPVILTIEGDRITGFEVGDNNETETIGSVAIDTIPGEVIEANSLDVDVVSGATHTSIALLKAAYDCLVQAGMPDTLDLEKELEQQ